MVCSICEEAGHRAPRCECVFVTETNLFLEKYWLPSEDNMEAYDERVKTWAREARFGLPVWRRLWEMMDKVLRWGTKNRDSLIALEYENIPHIGFVRPEPRTVADFKLRIANYVRPNALPEVMQRIIESSTARRAAVALAREAAIEKRVRAEAARRAREAEMMANLMAAREAREAREARRVLAREVIRRHPILEQLEAALGGDRVMDMLDQAHVQAVCALHVLLALIINTDVPAPKSKIQIQMEDNDASFIKENNCVCCMNPLKLGGVVAFGCNHVTCAECAPKVIKMVAANCPMCRQKISTIKFTRDMPTTTYNTLFSAVM
jgi:hypothetical protein